MAAADFKDKYSSEQGRGHTAFSDLALKVKWHPFQWILNRMLQMFQVSHTSTQSKGEEKQTHCMMEECQGHIVVEPEEWEIMPWPFLGNAICFNYLLFKYSDLICYSLFYPQMEMLLCPYIFCGNCRFSPLFVRVYKIAGMCPGPIKLGEIGLRNTVRNLCVWELFLPNSYSGQQQRHTTFIISSSIQLECFFFFPF